MFFITKFEAIKDRENYFKLNNATVVVNVIVIHMTLFK
jgi:hypothetical protein